MLGSAPTTPYDLRFRLFGVPVRVHPLFWLVMVFLSQQSNDLRMALVFVACAFLSILVHEFGHGLAGRLVGDEPTEVVLYAMGGYCAFTGTRVSPWRKVFVLACGPGAGFLLFGLVFAYALATARSDRSPLAEEALNNLLYINLAWGVLNLFPIWPLDGGRIVGVLLPLLNRRHGERWAHVLSLLTAGGLAAWWFSRHDFFMALWFGYFGYINYEVLRSMHDAHRYADRGDW